MNELFAAEENRYCFNADLPGHYNDAVLRVMLCNPRRLFVYWELPQKLFNSDLPLLLRLSESGHQTAGCNETTAEIKIPPGTNSYYIDVPFPGLAYTIELVGVASDGSRHQLHSVQQNVPNAMPANQPEFLIQKPMDTTADLTDEAHSSGLPERKKRQTESDLLPGINPRLLNRSSWSLPG